MCRVEITPGEYVLFPYDTFKTNRNNSYLFIYFIYLSLFVHSLLVLQWQTFEQLVRPEFVIFLDKPLLTIDLSFHEPLLSRQC